MAEFFYIPTSLEGLAFFFFLKGIIACNSSSCIILNIPQDLIMTKILIIDDDYMATTLIEKVLSGQGFETLAINDSTQAIHSALTYVPDLIVLDLMMPDPDGFKVCRMLREYPRFTFTPVIIVTALDDTDSKVVAFGAGADDYLTKPFRVEDLIERVKELLDRVG